MEKKLGRIAPGNRADFVILDRSPFGKSTDHAMVEPASVLVEGREAYKKSSAQSLYRTITLST